jgi:hypothetical protein
VPAKKKIKEKDCRRRFFHGPRRRCTTKLCPTIGRNPDAVELLRWCTNASMREWCSHAPTKFCGAQRSLCEAICTTSSTTIKCGHHWRILLTVNRCIKVRLWLASGQVSRHSQGTLLPSSGEPKVSNPWNNVQRKDSI